MKLISKTGKTIITYKKLTKQQRLESYMKSVNDVMLKMSLLMNDYYRQKPLILILKEMGFTRPISE